MKKTYKIEVDCANCANLMMEEQLTATIINYSNYVQAANISKPITKEPDA